MVNAPAQIKQDNCEALGPTPAERLLVMATEDMAAVDALILERMDSPVGMIPDLAQHLVGAGGKRLRPLLTVATARLCGYEGTSHHKLAAAVEFIHSATLLHDDVVDESALRRGQKPANLIWGNSASILVGDFLFARAFNLMVETDSMDASAKTAALFAAATEVSPVIAQRSEAERQALRDYGLKLGLAFQLVDDALDYGGFESALGKSIGDDFREGKMTLPVIRAVAAADKDETQFWRRVIVDHAQTDVDFETAVSLLRKAGALDATMDMARQFSSEANLSFGPNCIFVSFKYSKTGRARS